MRTTYMLYKYTCTHTHTHTHISPRSPFIIFHLTISFYIFAKIDFTLKHLKSWQKQKDPKFITLIKFMFTINFIQN